MPQPTNLILAANPQQLSRIHHPHSAIAHLAYQVAPGPTLMRIKNTAIHQSGFLYLSVDSPRGNNYTHFLQQIMQECRRRQFQGVICDLGSGCGALASALAARLPQQGLTVFLSEEYAQSASRCNVLISTAITSGTLHRRISKAMEQYGRDRTVPALQRIATDLTPPDPSGQGLSLSPERFFRLRSEQNSPTHWSGELHCKYFTYFHNGTGHIVLFDDRETMQAKLRLMGELGARQCLCAWGDLQ